MKVISIVAAGVALALIALTLAPWAGENRAYFAIGGLVCSVVVLVTIVFGWRERPSGALVRSQSEVASIASARADAVRTIVTQSTTDDTATSTPVKVVAPQIPANSGDAQVVGMLATFQEKGRLVDFLQDDISGYSDAQVGAAARVVHQGCKTVLSEYFRIVPVRAESEGAKVTVPAGYVADEYRLAGKISGQAPFSGTLMHRGWKAQSVSLPRVLHSGDDRLPTIAPAEIELR